MQIIKKGCLFVKGVVCYIKYKLLYGKRLKMRFVNSLRGRFAVVLEKGGTCSIGDFLMAKGPLYIKCGKNAQLSIGNRCFFSHNCSITCAEKIEIGDHCLFANNLVIVDHDHKIENGKTSGKELISSAVKIDNNVWCGANVVILRGVHIGEGAVIAAGAVVAEDIPAHTMAAGVPAKVIKDISNYTMK